MSIIERCIRQPVAVAVAVILIVIFGLIGLFRVPVQLTPNVDQPVVSISTRWFGAQPQEIEQEILLNQEEVLKTIPGLREMSSEAVEGQGTVRLEFYVGVDKNAIINEVEQKLNQVSDYPPDADRPVIESVDSSSRDWIAWMLIRPLHNNPDNLNPQGVFRGDVVELEQFLRDFVKPELERAEGVKDVQVLGGRVREMQVRVDLAKLASRRITIDSFVESLRDENRNVSAGAVAQGKRDVSVRAMGQYDDPQKLRDTVVGWTDAGAPVYVADVAEVGIGFKRQVTFVRSQGQGVMALNAKRETGTNVIEVMNNLQSQIQKVNADVLNPRGWGLELFQVYDQTVYVRRAVDNARTDLLLGGSLATIVLFLTLRSVGATLVVAISIPISVIGTFLGLAITGRNLNVISMAGLTFAIGMGVDNTIVVLENIFRHREMGKDALRAAIDGASEVWGAILAATLANIAVFLPVVFIQEEAGQLFQDISIAISISLLLYLFVSPTVIPVLATLFLRKMPGGFVEGKGGESSHEEQARTRLGRLTAPLARAAGAMSHRFYDLTLWFTQGFVRRLTLVGSLIAVAMIGSWLLIPPRTYLPAGNQNLMFAFVLAPPGYSISEFRAMGEHIERTLAPWWDVAPAEGDDEAILEEKRRKLEALQAGWREARDTMMVPMMEQQLEGMKASMPPEAFASASTQMIAELEELRHSPAPAGIDNFFFVTFEGNVFMGATSLDAENVTSLKYLFQQATQGIPGSFAIPIQATIFDLGDSYGSTVDVNISGPDYDQVRVAAGMAQMEIMRKMNVYALPNPQNFLIGRAEAQVIPDRPRAASAGVTTAAIRRAAAVAVDGEIIGDYREGAKSIDLTVISNTGSSIDGSRLATADDLRDVPLATRNGQVVPLSAVANILHTEAPQRIRRIEEQPAVTLSIQIPSNLTVQQAREAVFAEVIDPLREQGIISNDMIVRATGSADKLDSFMKAFIPGFALAALITYLLLAALFGSWLHPFVIIMSVPFALVGGFAGLWILHQTNGALLDVLTMLGFVILIGTIVNNPILIVHQALNYMHSGMEYRRAIALSTQTRVRPIFMSVITSVAGMAPLVVFGGAGSELYRGLGAVVIGGLLLSTFFTLFLTPALMSLMMDLSEGVRRLFGGGERGNGTHPSSVMPHQRDELPEAETVSARMASPDRA